MVWNIYVHPYFPNLTRVFQMRWNDQLVYAIDKKSTKMWTIYSFSWFQSKICWLLYETNGVFPHVSQRFLQGHPGTSLPLKWEPSPCLGIGWQGLLQKIVHLCQVWVAFHGGVGVGNDGNWGPPWCLSKRVFLLLVGSFHLKTEGNKKYPTKKQKLASLVEDDFRWVLYVITAYNLYICCIGIWILPWTKIPGFYLPCHVLSCVLVITFVAMLTRSLVRPYIRFAHKTIRLKKVSKNYWSSIVGWSWLILIWRIDNIYQNLFCQHTSMSIYCPHLWQDRILPRCSGSSLECDTDKVPDGTQ